MNVGNVLYLGVAVVAVVCIVGGCLVFLADAIAERIEIDESPRCDHAARHLSLVEGKRCGR